MSLVPNAKPLSSYRLTVPSVHTPVSLASLYHCAHRLHLLVLDVAADTALTLMLAACSFQVTLI